MMKDIKTFKQLLKTKWSPSICDRDDDCIRSSNDDVIFVLPRHWDEFQPACFEMKEREREKVFNLLVYSKEMFLLLESLDNEEAKILVNRIKTEKNLVKLEMNSSDMIQKYL